MDENEYNFSKEKVINFRRFLVHEDRVACGNFGGQVLNLLSENAFGIKDYLCFAQPPRDNDGKLCIGTICIDAGSVTEVFEDSSLPAYVVTNTGEEYKLIDDKGYILVDKLNINQTYMSDTLETEEATEADEHTGINTDASKSENDLDSVDTSVEISDFHPGTVDNPFIYNATNQELEKFITLIMFVAGKNASTQQKKLDQFIECVKRDIGEFSVNTLGIISAMHNTLTEQDMPDKIMGWLQEVKSGQYRRLCSGLIQLCNKIGSRKLSLAVGNRVQLISIKGIGRKSASMFLMYTRKNWPGACLDTHILKFLREEGGCPEAPLSTPSTKEMYNKYEQKFVQLARLEGKSIADYDFEIWSRYRDTPVAVEQPAVV